MYDASQLATEDVIETKVRLYMDEHVQRHISGVDQEVADWCISLAVYGYWLGHEVALQARLANVEGGKQ